MVVNINDQNKFEIGPPVKFGFREILLGYLLAFVPSLITGGLFGVGTSTILLIIAVVYGYIPFWYVLISLCCFVLSLIMLNYSPYLMNANGYIKAIVSNRQPIECDMDYICQVATRPGIYRGLRAFLEDADDVGVLTIHADRIEFRGDHINFNILPGSVMKVTHHNIGWRGFWFLGRRSRLLLDIHNKILEIDIAERQSSTISQSRKIGMTIYKAIENILAKYNHINSIYPSLP